MKITLPKRAVEILSPKFPVKSPWTGWSSACDTTIGVHNGIFSKVHMMCRDLKEITYEIAKHIKR
jgi:hypothetical protein